MKLADKLKRLPFFYKVFIPFMLSFLIIGASVITFLIVEDQNSGIKETTLLVQGNAAGTPRVLSIAPGKDDASFTSPSFKAAYEFNAIAPHWKESNAADGSREVSIRISDDSRQWSEWVTIEALKPQKNGAPYGDEVFPETPLITSGRYFEYKIELKRNENDSKSPEVKDLSVTYINSQSSKLSRISAKIGSLMMGSTAGAASAVPNVISRETWGSPDPSGTLSGSH